VAGTLAHLVAQIAYDPIPKPSERGCDLGDDYDGWFARCCAREPAERFATAGEAIGALAQALGVSNAPRSTASFRSVLRAPGLARALSDSIPAPGALKQTSSPLTLTDPSLAETTLRPPARRWGLLLAVAAGAAIGVAGVTWLSRSLWHDDSQSPSAVPSSERPSAGEPTTGTAPTLEASAEGGGGGPGSAQTATSASASVGSEPSAAPSTRPTAGPLPSAKGSAPSAPTGSAAATASSGPKPPPTGPRPSASAIDPLSGRI
jgi:serine/threonine-protein kinase